MFGFFKKAKEANTEKTIFVDIVTQMLKDSGEDTQSSIPTENLVLFYAVSLAIMTKDLVKGKSFDIADLNSVEKAAALCVLAQTLKFGFYMTGIENKNIKSTVAQNGMALLLKSDLHKPTPDALADMALGHQVFQMLQVQHFDIIEKLDSCAHVNLVVPDSKNNQDLVDCWYFIVNNSLS